MNIHSFSILTAVFFFDICNIDVTDHIIVDCYVLSNEKSWIVRNLDNKPKSIFKLESKFQMRWNKKSLSTWTELTPKKLAHSTSLCNYVKWYDEKWNFGMSINLSVFAYLSAKKRDMNIKIQHNISIFVAIISFSKWSMIAMAKPLTAQMDEHGIRVIVSGFLFVYFFVLD